MKYAKDLMNQNYVPYSSNRILSDCVAFYHSKKSEFRLGEQEQECCHYPALLCDAR